MGPVAADPTIHRQVLAAAREVLAAQPDAPIAEIASRAGVSRATFYRHFGSRAMLLSDLDQEPRPDARTRILAAAADMLVRDSLGGLSMDGLAAAAGVSRGTLYRIFPGKGALMNGLLDRYAPFEKVMTIVAEHRSEPPEVVMPLVAHAVAGVANEQFGLMRAVLLEVSAGSETAVSGVGRLLQATMAVVGEYIAEQMAAGRMRQADPMLAMQAFIGPIYHHLLSRPAFQRISPTPIDSNAAIDQLVHLSLAGLSVPDAGRQ